jgi:hypothetical protein
MHFLLDTTGLFENPSFSIKKIIKKALQQRPKGWELASSPNRTIFELFV